MDNALPPPSSRRRVTRQPNIPLSMSTAGPSRNPDAYTDQTNINFDNEPSRNLLDSMSDMEMSTPLSFAEETPAARLRMLMNQLPTEQPSQIYAPPSPSERESDYERPNLASSTTSSYRGSLKSLMSHALRPPGDTPQKNRRRNSIDTSEVDSSPRVQKVRQERAGAKGKRKSHSDEEADSKSQSDIHDIFTTSNTSADLRELRQTRPVATSTPQHSSQSLNSLHSYLQAQSNLLEQDSEMQRGLQNFESEDDAQPPVPLPEAKYTGDDPRDTIHQHIKSSPSQRTVHDGFHESSTSRTAAAPSPTPRRQQHYTHASTSLTRHSSSASISSISSFGSQPDHDVKSTPEREREMQWNKPRPRSLHSPSLNYSRSRTYSQPVDPRQSPLPSPSLWPSYPSSRSTSSASSRGDEEEEVVELKHERERNWNSSHPKWPRRQSLTNSRSNSPVPTSPSTSVNGHQRPSSRIQSSHDRPMSIHTSTPSPSRVPRQRPLSSSSPRPVSPLPSISPSARPRGGPTLSSSLKRSLTEIDVSPRAGLLRTTSSLSSVSPHSPSLSSLNKTGSSRNEAPKSPRSEIPVPISRVYESYPSLKPTSASISRSKSRSESSPGSVPKPSRQSTGLVSQLSPTPGQSTEQYDGQATDTDEDVPQESTPTLTPIVPLPSSPGSNRRLSPSNKPSVNESQLQKAVGSLHSPPLSPFSSPPSSPPTPPTSAPLFEKTLPKATRPNIEYQTPSPLHNLPDLPETPSSSSEDDANAGQETAAKTPRPPGAWSYTPAPRPTLRTRANSLPNDDENLSDQSSAPSTMNTPLSRVQSLPLQTPAPPGGWLMTPANKKSVRFDPISESDQTNTKEGGSALELTIDDQTPVTDHSIQNGILKPSTIVNTDVPMGTPTPPLSPSRSRREPRIRMVDEYGRAVDGKSGKEERTKRKGSKEDSPRNKSKIRIVDAMGRVVDESIIEGEAEVQAEFKSEIQEDCFIPPASRSEAARTVENGLSGMEKAMEDELESMDRKSSVFQSERIAELEKISSSARDQRRKLRAGSAESVRAMRRSISQAMMKIEETSSTPTSGSPIGWRDATWSEWAKWIGCALFIQFAIVLVIYGVLYRMTVARAHEFFLTTYYDPMSPELYAWPPSEVADDIASRVQRVATWVFTTIFGPPRPLQAPSSLTVQWGTS